MIRKIISLTLIFLCIFLSGVTPYVYAVGAFEEIEIKEEQELEDIYEKLKKIKKEGIEIHYRKETIIKEGVRDEKGYLKHLLSELETALKKGKKIAKINRVEGNLVEIDKGAIHKVHDRDVYIVYDSSGEYKGKIEIGAIADAISVGRSYELKKRKQLDTDDKIKFRGQRKIFEIGLIGGGSLDSTKYPCYGLRFEYKLRGGTGFEFLFTSIKREGFIFESHSPERLEYLFGNSEFKWPFLIKKYFKYPYHISPYLGTGLSLGEFHYEYESCITGLIHKRLSQRKYSALLNIGIQFITASLSFDLGVMYFHGPVIEFMGERIVERPMVGYGSISMTW